MGFFFGIVTVLHPDNKCAKPCTALDIPMPGVEIKMCRRIEYTWNLPISGYGVWLTIANLYGGHPTTLGEAHSGHRP